MTFGDRWDYTGKMPKSEAEKVFDAYVGAGGNFIDTANFYQAGQSEEWIGEFIETKNLREDLVIATKYSIPTKVGSVNLGGNSRKNMFSAVKSSLQRLRTTYIDILYVHFWDFATPPEEIMRGLNDLVSSGKIHYLGISDTPGWRVSQMNTMARERGWAEFVCYQGLYNVGTRDVEREIIPMCNELGMTYLSWGIVGQGKYTGRMKRGKGDTGGSRMGINMTDRDYDIAEMVEKIAKETGRSCPQVCTAWVVAQGNNIPIIGVKSMEQFEDNMKTLTLTLSEDQLKRLNTVSNFEIGFPLNFIGTNLETCFLNPPGGTIVPWTKK